MSAHFVQFAGIFTRMQNYATSVLELVDANSIGTRRSFLLFLMTIVYERTDSYWQRFKLLKGEEEELCTHA